MDDGGGEISLKTDKGNNRGSLMDLKEVLVIQEKGGSNLDQGTRHSTGEMNIHSRHLSQEYIIVYQWVYRSK